MKTNKLTNDKLKKEIQVMKIINKTKVSKKKAKVIKKEASKKKNKYCEHLARHFLF